MPFKIWILVIVKMIDIVSGCALSFSEHELYNLDIIHYNDFHARFQETSLDAPVCRYNNDSCLGGFPRLYYAIKTLFQEKPDAILLNAGDSFQGTYWYTLFKGEVIQHFLNMLPHDAHAIGNHDFGEGPEGLATFLAALKAPALAANMDATDEPILQGLYKSHIIVQRKGKKIGIIGLITPETNIFSIAGKVKFTDPKEATRREIEVLTQQGIDIIIILSHCGRPVDLELAKQFGEHVDIIVGGHSHRADSNPNLGPYPLIEESIEGDFKVLLVQAAAFSKYVGNLTVYFDFCGDYVKWEGDLIYLNRSIPEDKTIKEKMAPYAAMVHKAEKAPLGITETILEQEDCAYGECLLGDLFTDALNEYAKRVAASKYDYISFAQRGYLTITIPQGIITHGVVIELLSYFDQVETFELQGKYVLKALERSVSSALQYEPFKAPWLLQVSGLKIRYNVSLPEGHRVTSVRLGGSNAPLCKHKYYQITAPGYLAEGGDGYTMFFNFRRNMKVIGHDQRVLEAYIKKKSPLNLVIDGRIIINK